MADKDWRTVKLPTPLIEEIEQLRIDGKFNSNSDFISQATRELLEKYKKKRFEHHNFADNLIRLIDNEKPQGTPFIEIALIDNILVCRVCEAKMCMHIEEVWNQETIRKQLKRKGIKKPF